MIAEERYPTVRSGVLWGAAYTVTFVLVFTVSAGIDLLASGGPSAALTLQGHGDNSEIVKAAERTTIDISYINKNGAVVDRPVVLYEPEGNSEPRALVFVPHYEIDPKSGDLGNYLREGWAVASPADVTPAYNGALTDDDLVFNNAALHLLRGLPAIDPERIAVVGGSAGGYTALMLAALQMGTAATIASAPIANAYFNFAEYFHRIDEFTRHNLTGAQMDRLDAFYGPDGAVTNPLTMLLWARWSGLPFPILTAVFRSFDPVADNLPADSPVERWESFSPSGIARAISSALVINHNTADMLVPLDQITKRYSYDRMGKSLPDGFTNVMGNDYPGMLSNSLDEELDPASTAVNYTDIRGVEGDVTMPVDDNAMVNINVYDDGPPERNSTHGAVNNRAAVTHMSYLRTKLETGLAGSEILSREKLLLLIERYQGDSIQLPAHEGAPASIYGSLQMYQQEVIDSLARWTASHSVEELQNVATAAIDSLDPDDRDQAATTWLEIRQRIEA